MGPNNIFTKPSYDPLGDPKLIGDPYCTLFVGHLSHLTTEQSLRKALSKYGRVKDLRLVRHIVTGASRGYAFVEYETEREMQRAYKEAHHSFIDDSEVIVDYNRQQLMPGWIPRRLGGGLGGKKESGQLRFGGRERPFRAPLRSIPYDDLERLGIPPPPEGRYMSRYQVPSPPRRKRSSVDREEGIHKRSMERGANMRKSSPVEKEERSHKRSMDPEDHSFKRSSVETEHHRNRSTVDRAERSHKRTSRDRDDRSHKRHKSHRHERSTSHDHY
ncbi:hypothetical protein GBA52_003968 [Prunus armeniaca]|nr:hypothetical protein GBA52_003968 [Prunus armeniaca]